MEMTEIETLLADKPDALTFVKGLHSKAATLTPELEAEIAKLTDYKTGAAKAATLETELGTLKTAKADLEAKLKTAGKGKGEGSPEFLALQEKLTGLESKLGEVTTKLTTAETEKLAAITAQRDTDLKSSITTAAAKLKATDPEDIFILAKAKGLTGVDEAGKPFYRKLNDAGQLVAVANADEMLTAIHAKRKDLFQGSGVTGTGSKHGGTGDMKPETPSRIEARNAFLASRSQKK